MSFQTPITIREAIDNIHFKKYFLPSIQRELVWTPQRMELLFDSILQGYPINSFLIWEIKHKNRNEFQFYEFMKDFVEDIDVHNPKANVDTAIGDICAVLDGQQRLTSFYIGLMGSYSIRRYYGTRGKLSHYNKHYLYFNLLSNPKETDEEGKQYEFKFLHEINDDTKSGDGFYWYRVSDILNIKDPTAVNDFVHNSNISDTKTAFNNLWRLYEAIHKTPVVNYYLEKSEKLDKVVNIFIRINSGGVELDYADMLLSIASAQWKNKDAREEINKLFDEIRSIGFWSVKRNWILKAALFLADIKDIRFKVDNFNKANMLTIEKQWDKIRNTILRSIELMKKFGYDDHSISSFNAILPIAYYLHHYQNSDSFVSANKFKEKRKEIHKWFCNAILKTTFSGQPDNVLVKFRKALQDNQDFQYQVLKDSVKATNKNMTFNSEEIEGLLNIQYGNKMAYPVLSMLYGNPDFDIKPHLDHIHPPGTVTLKPEWNFDLSHKNSVVNLQLLNGTENIEKSDTQFDKWFNGHFKKDNEKYDYKNRHFIPDKIGLSPDSFDKFYESRKKLLLNRLQDILQ